MLNAKVILKVLGSLIILCAAFAAVSPASGLPPVYSDPDGVAIDGYDAVAYFTMGKPVWGDEKFVYSWNGAKWLFSSQAHRDRFKAAPEKYAPQYGGY